MTRLAFTEFDGYADAVRDVSVSMRICSREVSRWSLQYTTVGSVVVQQAFEGGGSIAEGANAPEGRYPSACEYRATEGKGAA